MATFAFLFFSLPKIKSLCTSLLVGTITTLVPRLVGQQGCLIIKFLGSFMLGSKKIIFYNLAIVLNNEASMLESFFQNFSMAGIFFYKKNFDNFKK
jgi:hypothetical protein